MQRLNIPKKDKPYVLMFDLNVKWKSFKYVVLYTFRYKYLNLWNIIVEVEYDYEAELQDELTIHAGDILTSVKQMSGGWWEGVHKGKRGLFPENFVKVCVFL